MNKQSFHHTEEFKQSMRGENNYFFGIHKFGKANPRYGKHLTEKTKQKLRGKALLRFADKRNHPSFGKSLSLETKIKIGDGNRGKIISQETIEKQRIASSRRKHTKATKKKMRQTHLGNNNPAWKGGLTPLYDRIRHLPEYEQWRSDVYERDNWTCQTCNKKSEGDIEAHHIKPFAQILRINHITNIWEAQFCKELWNVGNGVTLCEKCHNLTKLGRGTE